MKKKVVVIGGGLAGSLICNELVRGADVTLLETGSKDVIRFPRVDFVRKKFAEVNTFCFGGGGTTNLWHNGLIPINPNDISSAEFREILSDSEAYLNRTASSLFFTGDYAAEYSRLLSEINGMADKVFNFEDGVDCLIYPKKFKKLTVKPAVRDFYEVDDIQFVAEGKRIKSVKYSSGSKKYSIDTDTVIVSSGTLGTPKILQSVISATGNRFEKLGTGFIDHPMGFVGKVKFKTEALETVRKLSSTDQGGYISRNAVRLKSDCGKYTCCAFFRPALTMDNNLSIYKYKSSLGASNGKARLKKVFSFKILHPDIVAEIFSHLFGFNIPSRIYNILLIAEQKRGESRVFYENNQLKVDWDVSDEEVAVYRSALKKLEKSLHDVSDDLNIKTDITKEWLWSAAHHSCTSPVGRTGDDILDLDLKLKFCDNVFVCDGSVIQEHSYANTGLAIGQLALRLSERILNEPGK